ncbi:hypothetical protein ACLSU7_10885 [Bdellovibrio sp. HCB185ZH]|uniref:hypothetical protein n=1 Tax=Bdellovibrio sp. HCB185ZH TaxID=3394235 RepID=UPI0039A48DE2
MNNLLMPQTPTVPKWLRLYVRIAAIMYVPLILLCVHLQKETLPDLEEPFGILIGIGIPALLCIVPYLFVSLLKCPSCTKHFFNSNPLAPGFGSDIACNHCKFKAAG